MTYTVTRTDGAHAIQVTLTADECRRIYEAQQREYRFEDIENTLDLEFDGITNDAYFYVHAHKVTALRSYERGLENGVGWSDACRNAIKELLDDYETETGKEARA